MGLMWSFPSSPRWNCLNHGLSLRDTQALMATTRNNISLGNYLHSFFFTSCKNSEMSASQGTWFSSLALNIFQPLATTALARSPDSALPLSAPSPGFRHSPGHEKTKGAQGTVGTNRQSKKDQPCQGAHSGSPLFCVLTAPIMFLHSSQGICHYLFSCPFSCWTVDASVLPSSSLYSYCLEGCLTVFITAANTDSQALLEELCTIPQFLSFNPHRSPRK